MDRAAAPRSEKRTVTCDEANINHNPSAYQTEGLSIAKNVWIVIYNKNGSRPGRHFRCTRPDQGQKLMIIHSGLGLTLTRRTTQADEPCSHTHQSRTGWFGCGVGSWCGWWDNACE